MSNDDLYDQPDLMINPAISAAPAATLDWAPPAKPSQVQDAAQQFEALMIGQMLRSVREAARDDDSDSSGETMMDLADQQLSQLLARNGGLGLAQMIVKGLRTEEINHEDRHQRTEPDPIAPTGAPDQS
jgi:Rod binding domain-containing protein